MIVNIQNIIWKNKAFNQLFFKNFFNQRYVNTTVRLLVINIHLTLIHQVEMAVKWKLLNQGFPAKLFSFRSLWNSVPYFPPYLKFFPTFHRAHRKYKYPNMAVFIIFAFRNSRNWRQILINILKDKHNRSHKYKRIFIWNINSCLRKENLIVYFEMKYLQISIPNISFDFNIVNICNICY